MTEYKSPGPQSALSVLWAMDIFDSKTAQAYFDHLDLSAGEELCGRVSDICEWYPQVVLNRKYAVRTFAESLVDSFSDGCQVLVLGGGWSPVGLELLVRTKNVRRLIEVDFRIDDKSCLYHDIVPDEDDRFYLINKDITDADLYDELLRTGYNKDLPTVILLEGVSYNISKESLERLIRFFSRDSAYRNTEIDNYFILEYMLPDRKLLPEIAAIRNDVYQLIHPGMLPVTYTFDDIRQLIFLYEGEIFEHLTMKTIEEERLGENVYFPDDDIGWIECVTAKL